MTIPVTTPNTVPKTADRIDAPQHRDQDGLQEIGRSVTGFCRINPGDHYDRRHPRQQAGHHIDLHDHIFHIDAGETGRNLICSVHVNAFAQSGAVEHESHGNDGEDENIHLNGNMKKMSVADPGKHIRETHDPPA